MKNILAVLFFQNRVTFQICKELYYEKSLVGKIKKGVQLLRCIPHIGRLNKYTQKEIADIVENGNVYTIAGGAYKVLSAAVGFVRRSIDPESDFLRAELF